MKTKTKTKPNQLKKALKRFEKITVFATMRKRTEAWKKAEGSAEFKAEVENFNTLVTTIENARIHALKVGNELLDKSYDPPKKSTSGELKYEHNRQVWIKPKYQPIYLNAYTSEDLNKLFVDKVVVGRVILSVGTPDPNGVNKNPVVMAPKIHITGSQPST